MVCWGGFDGVLVFSGGRREWRVGMGYVVCEIRLRDEGRDVVGFGIWVHTVDEMRVDEMSFVYLFDLSIFG